MAPIVNAGTDQVVGSYVIVTLAGSSSGTTYTSWTQSTGPIITLNGAGTMTPTFKAPGVPDNTDMTFTLTGSDGTDTVTDIVKITVLASDVVIWKTGVLYAVEIVDTKAG